MLSTKMLSWNAATKTFAGEISDAKGSFCRAYPDACDEGVRVCNPDTGAEVMYVTVRSERDNEGDLIALHMEPTPESVRRVPGSKGTKLVLFND